MELFRALGCLAEPPAAAQRRLGGILGLPGEPDRAAHTELFAFQLYPYASVYLGAEGMLGGVARDRVAGFWRALGLVPPAEPDHLTTLLALYATLEEKEAAEPDPARSALVGQARRALFDEHLAPWLGPFLDKLSEVAPPFYHAWGELLRNALRAERAALGPADALPAHLRDAPPPVDPAEGPDAWVRALLAPVRSGMILTRSDLVRASRELDLALRLGERRFILHTMLQQDPHATVEWLSAEAERWAERHERREADEGDIARFWAARARHTAASLRGEALTVEG